MRTTRTKTSPIDIAKIDPSDGDETIALGRYCAARFRTPNSPKFQAAASVLAQDLPRQLRAKVIPFRANYRSSGLVIRGIPVDDSTLEPTPPTWREADGNEAATYGFVAALVGSILGECISWETQQEGRLVTDVVPTRGMENSLVSSSSTKELGWHTEDAFSRARADFLGLFALRSPHSASTTISKIEASEIPVDIAMILREPRFVTRPDDAHSPEAMNAVERAPILSGSDEFPQLRIDRDFTDVADPEDTDARVALDAVISHLDERISDAPMQPGDLALIDNRRVVHGRRPFQPRFDGTDRWLKRVNIVADFGRTDQFRPYLERRVIGVFPLVNRGE